MLLLPTMPQDPSERILLQGFGYTSLFITLFQKTVRHDMARLSKLPIILRTDTISFKEDLTNINTFAKLGHTV